MTHGSKRLASGPARDTTITSASRWPPGPNTCREAYGADICCHRLTPMSTVTEVNRRPGSILTRPNNPTDGPCSYHGAATQALEARHDHDISVGARGLIV